MLAMKAMEPNELKQIRKAKNLTQTEFADWLGCSKHAVVAWEVGRNTIPAWVVERLRSDTLKINPVLTLEQFQLAAETASQAGQTMDEWIASLMTAAIQLPRSSNTELEKKNK